LTDDGVREANTPSSEDRKTPPRSFVKDQHKPKRSDVEMGHSQWVKLQENQNYNYNKDSYEAQSRSYEPQNHGMVKSNTEKQGFDISNMQASQECRTPKRSKIPGGFQIRHGYNEYYTHHNKSQNSKK
jgi:hypothetical protein